jgi:CRP-like cAMP-binding protein
MASPDVIERLGQFSIFTGFSPEELTYVRNLVREEVYRSGQIIFAQGQPTAALYLVDSGIVREEWENAAGQTVPTREAEAGDVLGRWSVFNKEPYQTTARAHGTTKLLAISNDDCDTLLQIFPILRTRIERVGIANRLIAIPLFSGFSEEELFYIADLVKEREYPAGETVFEEGEEADAFYVIDTGQVMESTSRRTVGTQSWPKYFTAGHFFGRWALVNNTRRRATAEAVTDARVFRISAYDFDCLRQWTPDFDDHLGRFAMLRHLRQTPLFSRLNEKELKQLAGFAGLAHYRKHEVIFYQGEVDETFYILYEGEAVTHFRDERGRERPLRGLQAGDTIGEASLFFRGECDVTLRPTTASSNWLYLTRTDLELFLAQRPEVRSKLLPPEPIRARQRLKRFSWMDPDEKLVFEDRRHWYFLLRRLAVAIVLLLVGGIGLLAGLSPEFGLWIGIISALLLLGGALFGGWRFIDWFNDYYVITDRRVVHQEKLLLIRETRDEAPLGKIQNVNIAQLFVGNLLGFGILLINTAATFTAERVVFDYLTNPRRVQQIIFEQMERARLGRRPVVRRAVRDKLQQSASAGLRPVVPRPVIPPGAVRSPQPSRPRIMDWIRKLTVRRWFWFEKRTAEQITWRKHWLFLIRRVWMPTLVSLGLLVLLVSNLIRAEHRTLEGILPLAALLLLSLGWLWWNWENWGNDQYIVTTDRIIDTEALPLGFRSQRTETTFDRIQNVSFEIPHPIATIFNYGTVFIFTAGAEGRLDFQWLRDPSRVQAEIFRRLAAYEQGQRQQQAEEQRAELPEWFDTHREIHHP